MTRTRGHLEGLTWWNLLVTLSFASIMCFGTHGAWLGEQDTVLLHREVGSEDLNQRLRDFGLKLEASHFEHEISC